MDSNDNHRFITLFIFIVIIQPGCAAIGTAFIGSSLGVAGQQGVSYFASGNTSKIFYYGMDRSIYSVEKSFYDLSITMEKKEKYSDGKIHFTGKTESPEGSDVEVTLRAISKNVTEIVVVSRKGIFPDRAICHTLMAKIAENFNHTRANNFGMKTW